MTSGSQQILLILWHLECSPTLATSACTGPDEVPSCSLISVLILSDWLKNFKHIVLLII